MCLPAPFLLGAAALGSTAVAIKTASDNKKAAQQAAAERAAAAEETKKQATEAKTAADMEVRDERKVEYETRRKRNPRNATPRATPGALFAPRSFFSPV